MELSLFKFFFTFQLTTPPRRLLSKAILIEFTKVNPSHLLDLCHRIWSGSFSWLQQHLASQKLDEEMALRYLCPSFPGSETSSFGIT